MTRASLWAVAVIAFGAPSRERNRHRLAVCVQCQLCGQSPVVLFCHGATEQIGHGLSSILRGHMLENVTLAKVMVRPDGSHWHEDLQERWLKWYDEQKK